MKSSEYPNRNSPRRNTTAVLVICAGMLLQPHGNATAQSTSGLLFEPQPLAATTPSAATIVEPLPEVVAPTRQRSDIAWPAPPGAAASPVANVGSGQNADADALRNIRELEAAEGPYAASLAPRLLELGRVYQQQQEHEKALAEFSRAAQISRVSFGLDTPEQYPAIELGIESHLALLEYQKALEQQQALVTLYQAHYGPDSPETVPRLATLGDMYFAAFHRELHKVGGGSGLTMVRGPMSAYVDPAQLSPEALAFLWLDQARANYIAAIAILLKNKDYQNSQLMSLESSVIETLFLLAHRQELQQEPEFFMSVEDDIVKSRQDMEYDLYRMALYREGEKSLQRMVAYQSTDASTPPLRIASTMLQLGDWHFLFGKHRQSRAAYAQASKFLQSNGVAATDLQMLLNPPLPVQLPAFIAQPHSLDSVQPSVVNDLNFDGYIDVAFKVSKFGKVTDLEVLDKSANADTTVERRLKKVLNNAPFRPGVTEDGDTAEQRYAVRYSFAQL